MIANANVLVTVAEGSIRAAPAGAARVLLVGLEAGESAAWAGALAAAGMRCETSSGLAALRALPCWREADLVIASAMQPDGSLAAFLQTSGSLPLVVVADAGGQAELSALLRHAPLDLWLRPTCTRHVVGACTALLGRALRRGAPLLPELGSVGVAIARTRLPVLVVGETGTGKSRLARMLHETLTPESPFVEVNAASLAGPLLGSELFGHERGAFTGAHASRPGLVARAHGGTIFFDEIGELSLESQAQLLSYLDTGMYRPIGAARECHSDARVFCATNRDLAAQVNAGKFREDLYYRLASIVVPMAPLREHPGRIPALCQEVLAQVQAREGTPSPRLSEDALATLASFSWPGNVRQLRFVMERLAALAPGERVDADGLAPLLATALPRQAASPTELRPLAQMEEELVILAMQRAGGNRSKAAEMLGITPRGLYNKLRRLGRPFLAQE